MSAERGCCYHLTRIPESLSRLFYDGLASLFSGRTILRSSLSRQYGGSYMLVGQALGLFLATRLCSRPYARTPARRSKGSCWLIRQVRNSRRTVSSRVDEVFSIFYIGPEALSGWLHIPIFFFIMRRVRFQRHNLRSRAQMCHQQPTACLSL